MEKPIIPTNYQIPPEEELPSKRDELAELEGLLAEKELEYANTCTELGQFRSRYYEKVARLYVELDDLEARVAERAARRNPSSAESKDQAKAARTQAEETANSYEELLDEQDEVPEGPPSESLKTLYRQVAKRLHPDLTLDPEEKERRTTLMARASEAYRMHNEEALQQVLDEYNESPEIVEGDGVASDLVRSIRTIAQVKRRIGEVEQCIEGLKESDLWELFVEAKEAERQGRDLLEESATSLQHQIDGIWESLKE